GDRVGVEVHEGADLVPVRRVGPPARPVIQGHFQGAGARHVQVSGAAPPYFDLVEGDRRRRVIVGGAVGDHLPGQAQDRARVPYGIGPHDAILTLPPVRDASRARTSRMVRAVPTGSTAPCTVMCTLLTVVSPPAAV